MADATAHGGTESEASRVFSAAVRKSSTVTQCLSPFSSTQLAFGDHGEDAWRAGVGLDVGGVVELLALGDDQLAHPAAGVGERLDRRSCRKLGAQPVVTGLDRRNRLVALRSLEEHFDGSDDVLFVQRLADRRGRVAGVYLDHQVLFTVAGEVVLRTEAVPHPGADEHGRHHHADAQAHEDSAGRAASTTFLLGAETFGARTQLDDATSHCDGPSALPAVRHR